MLASILTNVGLNSDGSIPEQNQQVIENTTQPFVPEVKKIYVE